jgi:hypothetical protein
MRRDGREDAIALDDELFRVLPDGDGEDEDLDVDAPARGRGRRARADRWDNDDGEGLRADRRDGRRGSGRGLWLPLGALLGVALLGWGAWMVLAPAPEPTPATGDMMAVVAPLNGGGLNDLPLIEADPTPYKQEPGDPGGLQVENTDKQVYERVRDSAQVDDGAAVEQLLPGPVRPVAPPEPEPQPAPAPVAAPAPSPAPPSPAQPSPEPAPASPPSTPAVPDGPVAGAAPSVPAVPGAAPPAVQPANPTGTETPTPAAAPTAPEQPATPAAPAPAPAESVTAAVESGPQVQLAAFRQRALAQAHWETLLAAHPDLLGNVPHVIVFADLGDRGQYYRLRAGPFGAAEQAQTLCGALKQRDVECLVVRE